jgi:hypothetical protein
MKKLARIAAKVLIPIACTNAVLADHVRKDYDHNVYFTYIRNFSFGDQTF